LVRDTAGNLFGVTQNGGDNTLTCFGFTGCGVAFKLAANGKETTLHTFELGTDGGYPYSTLTMDGSGNLYGTTEYGGDVGNGSCPGGCGTVFKIDPAGNETVLHRSDWYNGVDGAVPIGGVVLDAEGNIYGTTSFGGSPTACMTFGCGTVFKLDQAGNETILYDFGDLDAGDPWGPLVRAASGNLYGTSYAGGKYSFGAVFKVDASGKETVLHNFTGGRDGAYLTAPLFRDSAGNFYGTAELGGQGQEGVVFVLKP
jgi:uncharacterized repeat protein (TIGR03803 family)